ncbi:hypothetical protein MVEN_02309000 [Mycena venus]|uniref:Restriction of telomere capping protein 4 C-terminal domain-containing protein n=1 Tax=Mycena venus TaxID=2733690 RepID=A0A8H6X3Z3_9AGAR|nr:hypothetical protein MVEN_02309000 [Mycena venus]
MPPKPRTMAEELEFMRAKLNAQQRTINQKDRELETLRNQQISKKPRLIPRPNGQAGRSKNGFNLKDEMQLSNDSTRYERLLRIIRSYANQYLPIRKTIKDQNKKRLDKLVILIQKDVKYFRRFQGGWPMHAMIKQYLQNAHDKHKRDLRLEREAEKEDSGVWDAPQTRTADEAIEEEDDEMSVDGEDGGADVHNGEEPLMDADFDWGDENGGLKDTVTPKRQNDADKENDLPGEVVVSQEVVTKKAKRSQKIILESPLTTPVKPAKRKATTDANDDGTSVPRKRAKAILDNRAHSPLNVSKAQNPNASSKSAPLPSLKLELPAICPANYCKDPVPKDPGNELALLFLEKQAFVAKHGKNAPGASQFTRRICENIKLENRRLECRREARVNAWPLEIDYSELPNCIEAFEDEIYQIAFDGPQLAECPIWQSFLEAISYKVHAFSLAEISSFSPGADSGARCGYFGARGKAVIMSTLENFIQDRLAPDQIYQTVACLYDTPEQWDEPDEDFTLMSDVQFLEYILAPFVAASLISDDFECDLLCAIEIMRASSEFGDLFHSDMLVPSPVPSPVKNAVKKIEPKPMISKPSSQDALPVEPPKQGPQAKNLESKSSTSVPHANTKTMAKSVTKTTMTNFPPPEIRKKNSEPKSQLSKKSKNIADTIAPHTYGTRSNTQR